MCDCSADGEALPKILPEDTQPQHQVQSPNSESACGQVHKLSIRCGPSSANSVNSYVDGDAASERLAELDIMLALGNEPSAEGNFFDFAGCETDKDSSRLDSYDNEMGWSNKEKGKIQNHSLWFT